MDGAVEPRFLSFLLSHFLNLLAYLTYLLSAWTANGMVIFQYSAFRIINWRLDVKFGTRNLRAEIVKL